MFNNEKPKLQSLWRRIGELSWHLGDFCDHFDHEKFVRKFYCVTVHLFTSLTITWYLALVHLREIKFVPSHSLPGGGDVKDKHTVKL